MTRPVFVNGALGIARNAVATGRVVDIKKAQGWGRPGELTWEMEDVFAVDGTRVPLRVSESLKGTTRVPTMIAGAAATAALLFPYTSPAALVWAFKKGDDAILFGSRRFTAMVGQEARIASPVRRQHGISLFSAEAISRSRNPTMMDQGRENWSFRPVDLSTKWGRSARADRFRQHSNVSRARSHEMALSSVQAKPSEPRKT